MNIKYLLVCLFLSIGLSYAQNRPLSLEECLSTAMDNNPELKAVQKEIDIFQARNGSYLDLPGTRVELSQSSTEGAGMDNGLTFSQEFDFPTVYIGKRKVYKAEEKFQRVQYSGTVSELRGKIFSIYFSLLSQKARFNLLIDDYSVYDDFARISKVRYEEGESSRLELLNADRMRSKMEARIEETRLAIGSLQLELANAIGSEMPVDISDNEIFLLNFDDSVMDFNASATPDSKLMNARIEVNEKNEWLARQEFLPGLSVSATSQLLIKGFNPYDVERERFNKGNFMGFAVGITVPLFFSAKRSKLIATKREIELSRIKFDEGILRQSVEFDKLKNDLILSKKRLDYYDKEGLNQAADFRRLAAISYELGEIDYLEYMQNIENSLEIGMEYIETIDRFNQSVIKIQTLKGQI